MVGKSTQEYAAKTTPQLFSNLLVLMFRLLLDIGVDCLVYLLQILSCFQRLQCVAFVFCLSSSVLSVRLADGLFTLGPLWELYFVINDTRFT
jgi:hypothetical protein